MLSLLTLLSLLAAAPDRGELLAVDDLLVSVPSFGLNDVEQAEAERLAHLRLIDAVRLVAEDDAAVDVREKHLSGAAADLPAVCDLLADLRARRSDLVTVSARFLASEAPLDALPLDLRRQLAVRPGQGVLLDDVQVETLLAEAAAVAAPRLTLFDGQRAWVAIGGRDTPTTTTVDVLPTVTGDDVLLTATLAHHNVAGDLLTQVPAGSSVLTLLPAGDDARPVAVLLTVDVVRQEDRAEDDFPAVR